MNHPHYSPDLAPWDFLLFQKLKKKCPKGTRFADIPDIQHNVTLVRGILQSDFQDCFQQWHHCLTKYIASQGVF
jgi:hypothetical protein